MSQSNKLKLITNKISGWGKYPVVETAEHFLHSSAEIQGTLRYSACRPDGFIARGLGRSYGDSSLASHTIYLKKLNRILKFNPEKGIIQAEAGISFEDLLHFLIPRGFFLPVTPGTKYITLGGAAASDVHGKNHHVDGSFCDHILSMELLKPDGSIIKIQPNKKKSEVFRATCAGMGLTGVILSVEFKLKRIETSLITTQSVKAKNIDDIMQKFEESDKSPYSVAWIDCLARGNKLGRSILMTGDHTSFGRLHDMKKERAGFLRYNAKPKLNVPFNIPSFVLNPLSIKAFNFLYYHKGKNARRPFLSKIDPFFYPLDSINNWNRMYGGRGFVQYQFVLPEKNSRDGMVQILEKISASGYGSFLAVLKKFGNGNSNYLSFPSPGYTLALDFPVKKKVFHLLNTLDDLVQKHGGHLYLTKDSRMSREFFQGTQKNLKKFLEIKKEIDKEEVFASEQYKRLF